MRIDEVLATHGLGQGGGSLVEIGKGVNLYTKYIPVDRISTNGSVWLSSDYRIENIITIPYKQYVVSIGAESTMKTTVIIRDTKDMFKSYVATQLLTRELVIGYWIDYTSEIINFVSSTGKVMQLNMATFHSDKTIVLTLAIQLPNSASVSAVCMSSVRDGRVLISSMSSGYTNLYDYKAKKVIGSVNYGATRKIVQQKDRLIMFSVDNSNANITVNIFDRNLTPISNAQFKPQGWVGGGASMQLVLNGDVVSIIPGVQAPVIINHLLDGTYISTKTFPQYSTIAFLYREDFYPNKDIFITLNRRVYDSYNYQIGFLGAYYSWNYSTDELVPIHAGISNMGIEHISNCDIDKEKCVTIRRKLSGINPVYSEMTLIENNTMKI